MSIENLNLSLPLSTLLKVHTKDAHKNATNLPAASLLIKGELSRDDYVRYLMVLWHVYNELELALERHADHVTLAPINNTPLLARAPRLSADIAFFLQVPESCWQGHPIHLGLVTGHAQPLEQYVHRLRELGDAPDPSPLLAHAYVRYFGDLSGGQILRRTLAKVYGLDLDAEEGARAGLSFYEFTVLGGDRRALANPAQISHIKEWLRAGIDTGSADDPELKSVILREALIAFDMSNSLFGLIPLVSSVSPEEKNQLQQRPEKPFELAKVISVLLAAWLAHSILVMGNTDRSKGCFMLQTLGLDKLIRSWV